MLSFVPDSFVLGGDIEISWTRQPDVIFFIVLAHYEPVMIKKALVKVFQSDPLDGLTGSVRVLLSGVPAIDGYVLQATNISNLNEIWDQSEAFSIGDPTSLSTSATNGPASTAAPSTRLGSSSISSTITTSLSSVSQSIPTLSSSSPTSSLSATSSVPDTVIQTPSQTSDSQESIPLGSIVGGILGGLVLILLLGFALVFYRMRHKKKRLADHEDFSVDPKMHEASVVTPFAAVSLPHDPMLDSASSRSHRNFPSTGHTKSMTHELDYATDDIPKALTPGISTHTSQSLRSQMGLQPPESSMHETASIGGTSITDYTGRPSAPSVPYTDSRPAQHTSHIPAQQSPGSLPPESATVVPGRSTGASSNATQQPWRPLMVVGGTSYDIDDEELPPPSYHSGILKASVREK